MFLLFYYTQIYRPHEESCENSLIQGLTPSFEMANDLAKHFRYAKTLTHGHCQIQVENSVEKSACTGIEMKPFTSGIGRSLCLRILIIVSLLNVGKLAQSR